MLSLARTTLHADFVKYIASAPLAVKTRTQFVVDVVLSSRSADWCSNSGVMLVVVFDRSSVFLDLVQALYVPNATLYSLSICPDRILAD